MHRSLGWIVGVLLLGATVGGATPVKPSEPADKIIEEFWESAHLDGAKIGSVHTTILAVGGDDKRLRATVALELTFKRHNAVVQLRMEQGDEETADGAVIGVFMRQFQDKVPKVALSGALEDDGKMHVQIDGGRIDRRLRWSDEIVGVRRLDHFFQERKPAPDSRYAFPCYQPTLNAVVMTRVTVREEGGGGGGGGMDGGRKSLLRVELRPDKIDALWA